MRNFLLSSTAAFSPPDENGAAPTEPMDQGTAPPDNGTEPSAAAAEPAATPPAAKEDHAKPRVESVSESVRRAATEVKDNAAAAAAKAASKKKPTETPAQEAGAAPSDATAQTSPEAATDGNTATAPQAASGPPQSWSKEGKAVWDSLPDAAKAEITRREADTAKGVQELRTRYQDIDTAVAPYKAVMTQNNVTPAQAISQLFKWHMELAGPNKVAAFQQLAKSFGIDPATIAAPPAAPAETPPGADPSNTIPDNLRPVITDLQGRLKQFEDRESAAMQNAAKQTWVNWSKDKPHAERVRQLMANLINSDLALIQAGQPQVSNTIKDGSIDMDAAYQAAIYAHPEVRQLLLQEERAEQGRKAKAAAEQARKAGAGLRNGAPAAPPGPAPTAPKVESVRDSISRALAEVRGVTQH